jgi:TolB-like protein
VAPDESALAARREGDIAFATEPPRAKCPSLAVLPFVNLSSAADQEYFSDGVTTDVIARLSRRRLIPGSSCVELSRVFTQFRFSRSAPRVHSSK